ncbi:hypothetical protein BDQ17DRAFT_1382982 [Cyathus striatus]|nr:hypothetical protein BDQ17DRAFT_1382982 [Cyathus striatus]
MVACTLFKLVSGLVWSRSRRVCFYMIRSLRIRLENGWQSKGGRSGDLRVRVGMGGAGGRHVAADKRAKAEAGD